MYAEFLSSYILTYINICDSTYGKRKCMFTYTVTYMNIYDAYMTHICTHMLHTCII